MAQKVDLNEIKNIPEDEFKKNLFEWIEQMDISKELQSKLRSDLFQNFGKTALGRQIAAQYQHSQRIVLSPLVLVVNTLVAEFLYAQNCHFTLSVFNTEVPYKNTLPDFEKNYKFRFDSAELQEIMRAVGLDNSEIHKSEVIQMYQTPQERDGILLDTSLLFCIIKTLSSAATLSGKPYEKCQPDVKEAQTLQDDKCNNCKNNCMKPKKDELHSKYYKHFYKYLDLLSQHVVEITENTKKLKEKTKSEDKHSRSSLKNCHLNKRLDKITESLKNLSKSNRKGRKISEIIKSVTRLTNEIQRCSSNVAKYSNALNQSSEGAAKSVQSASTYTEWLSQMTGSAFGQRFIRNLEVAQEKAITNEVQKMKETFNEKFQTTRKLIKLHYKQKTFEKFRSTMLSSPVIQSRRDDFNQLIDEKLRLLKEKENYWRQNLVPNTVKVSSNDDMIPNHTNQMEVRDDHTNMSKAKTDESILPKNRLRVDSNIQPPIKSRKTVNIEIFDEPPRPIEPVIDTMVQVARNRLQELENESELLDKSFQIYLKKQNEQKQILADDAAKVWQQYERAKDNMIKTFVVPERRNHSTSIHFNELVLPTPTEEPIAPLLECKTNLFENPYKKLHASLKSTGFRGDLSISKKEIAIQANGSLPTVTIQQIEEPTSADKVSQIPIPMKIKSIMKKPMESKTHLRITKSVSSDHQLSDPSDASSSYINLKNLSPSDVHFSDSKPSDASIKSKVSENSLNSIESNQSERFRIEKPLIEKANFVPSQGNTNGLSTQIDSVSNVTGLFEKIELKNRTNSNSSDSYDKKNISTGQRSSSSEDFWK